MHAPSCTFTLFPSRIKFTSPRTTALNQILQSSPITTSPTIVELGAKKQLLPNSGNLFSTGSITGIRENLMFEVYGLMLPAFVPIAIGILFGFRCKFILRLSKGTLHRSVILFIFFACKLENFFASLRSLCVPCLPAGRFA